MDKDIKFLQDDLLKSGISHNNKPFKKELYEEFSKINYKEEAHLQDLSSLFCFSIDGKSTNDRDDIISFEKNIGEDTYSLGIHISNVASFIPYKSLIDIEASNRSSSIYSLNANISMLPQYFIEKFGSLDPFKLRKSLSVLIKIDADANILDSEIIVSKVENKLALKYEDVELILKDKNHKLFSLFEQLYSVSSILNNKRITKEALILDKPNMEINLLDNGEIDVRVADQIANSKIRADALVIGTGTIGPKTAKEIHAQLEQKHIGYVDSPVSGMAIRAREGTLASMYSGSKTNLERIRPLVSSYSANVYHVGAEPGQGQLMKLVNNYLGISHFVTTSEAITCGLKGGLKIETLLEVIEAASGQNFVASHIFPRYMVPETYDSGGPATLPHKDLALYVDAAKEMGTPHHVSSAALEILKAFVEHDPQADQSTIYRFIKDNS